MSKSKSGEVPANVTAVLKKAVGNASATLMLEKIVFWCTRPKGGVMHEGRLWSYRTQAAWIELAGLKERTGKSVFKLLVERGFILAEMRLGGPLGNRKLMMHVALSDKTYALLEDAGVPHLQMPVLKAELAKQDKPAAEWKAKPVQSMLPKPKTPKMNLNELWDVSEL